jgi:pimeloyl-ACP methyl ester carboxylesterase
MTHHFEGVFMNKGLWAFILIAVIFTGVFAQTVPLSNRFNEKIDVGGYKLRISCLGEGSPTVIIEAGFGGPAVGDFYWARIVLAVATNNKNRVCAYDRAGLGASDPILTESRTSQDVVNDLHALLTNANILGPYVLVGHSLGGFHVRLFTEQYSDEIAGMVLVDSSHPNQFAEFLTALPPVTPNTVDVFKKLRDSLNNLDTTNNPEKFNIEASIAQLQNVRSLGELPLIVLTQNPNCDFDPTQSSDIEKKISQLWQTLQAELASLSTNSTHIIAAKACHDIQIDEPQLVIDAILKIVNEIQNAKQ